MRFFHFTEVTSIFALLIFVLTFRPWGFYTIAALYFAGVLVIFATATLEEGSPAGATMAERFCLTCGAVLLYGLPFGFVCAFAFVIIPGKDNKHSAKKFRSLLFWRCCLLYGMVWATVYNICQTPALQQHLQAPLAAPIAVLATFGSLTHLPSAVHQWYIGRWHADPEYEGSSSTYELITRVERVRRRNGWVEAAR